MSVPPSISVQRRRERRRSARRVAALRAACCSLPCSTAVSMAPRLRLAAARFAGPVFRGPKLRGASIELLQVLVQPSEQLQQLLALLLIEHRDHLAARLIGDLPHARQHRLGFLAQVQPTRAAVARIVGHTDATRLARESRDFAVARWAGACRAPCSIGWGSAGHEGYNNIRYYIGKNNIPTVESARAAFLPLRRNARLARCRCRYCPRPGLKPARPGTPLRLPASCSRTETMRCSMKARSGGPTRSWIPRPPKLSSSKSSTAVALRPARPVRAAPRRRRSGCAAAWISVSNRRSCASMCARVISVSSSDCSS